VTTHQSTHAEPSAAIALPAIAHVAAAVDSYSEGRDATMLAAAISRAVGADIMLLAVEPDLPLIIPGLQRKRVREETEAMLRDTSAAFAPDARRTIDCDLSIARGIERLVRAEHRDLVVVGSSRHGDEGRISIGHVTRQLLSDLGCALAVAPRGLSAGDPLTLRRVGVGFDAGPESRAALVTAARIAEGAGARLVVRGAIDDRVPPLGWPNVWMGAILESWEEMMDEEERDLRESITAALAGVTAEAEIQITRGRPHKSLVALSADVDLLVIGSRRWGPLARLLLGGTGEALVHGAACSLLIVPRPAAPR
jgi:nucleotide-binding universal stress UspA family protein